MEIWLKDEKTSIECGINIDGNLFLGNKDSGYNLPNTEENKTYIINDFYRYTNTNKIVIL